MIKPELLTIYINLYETLSFTRTAEVLHIPKSTVSDSIKRLEEILGVNLVKRTTRKVQITEEGELFFEKAQQSLIDLAELETLFLEAATGPLKGKLRVDMPIGLSKNLILSHMKEFLDDYPELKVEISSTDRRVDLIAEGFDFVIRVGSLRDSSLIARKIGEFSLINCVGKKYILTYGQPTSLKNLDSHYQIHYLQNLGVGHDGFEYFDGKKYQLVKTKSLITVNNSVTYTEACLQGMGLIQAPAYGLKDYLDSGELVQVLKKYKAQPLAVYLVYPNRERIPKRVSVFMNWCERLIKEHIF